MTDASPMVTNTPTTSTTLNNPLQDNLNNPGSQ